jgi:putative oxidoreductase
MAMTTVVSETRTIDVGGKESMTFWRRLIATSSSAPLLVARLGLAIVFLPHGLQKVSTLFGGHGFMGTMGFFEDQGIPSAFAFLAIVAEFLGSLGLITGFLTRIAAFGIFCNMMVAMLMVHMPNGFFMNWSGQQAGEGVEFHILAITLSIVLMIAGAGLFSVDRAFYKSGDEGSDF